MALSVVVCMNQSPKQAVAFLARKEGEHLPPLREDVVGGVALPRKVGRLLLQAEQIMMHGSKGAH